MPRRISETILADTRIVELPEMFVSGDRIYVAVEGESIANAILVTDGTVEGTQILDAVISETILETPRVGRTSPTVFHRLEDGDVLFSGLDSEMGNELWRTDGTNEGTYRVKDILLGPDSSSPNHFWQFDGMTYFEAMTSEHGREMWRTDGTESGTALVEDTNRGMNSGGFRGIGNFDAASGPMMLFATLPQQGGSICCGGGAFVRAQMWITDGTFEGTNQLTGDRYLGRNQSDEYVYAASEGWIAYTARGEVGPELRFTDGSSDFVVASDLNFDFASDIKHLQHIGGKLFFVMQTNEYGVERFVSDGSVDGTRLVEDLNQRSYGSSSIRLLGQLGNGRLLVDANWRLESIDQRDGTRVVLKDTSSSDIGDAALLDDLLVFEYDGAVWTSDGTESGTQQLREFTRPVSNFQRIGDRILFRLDGAVPSPWTDRPVGDKPELWETDGTPEGTKAVAEFDFVGDDSWRLHDTEGWNAVTADGKIFYVAGRGEETYVWSIDGDEKVDAVLSLGKGIPPYRFWRKFADYPLLSVWNEQLFFLDASGDHKSLFVTDDANQNRTLLTDQPVKRFLLAADYLYFEVVAPGDWEWQRTELWRTDGTPEGTISLRVQDPTEILELNGKVYVVSNEFFGSTPPSLWTTDETGKMKRVTELGSDAAVQAQLYDNNGSMIIWLDGQLLESNGSFEGMNSLDVSGYNLKRIPDLLHDDLADGVFFTPTTVETGLELFRIHSDVESHPTVIDVSLKKKDADPGSLESVAFQFDSDVGASLQTNDLKIRSNSNRGIAIDLLLATMSWDPATKTATWDLSSIELGDTAYTLELDGKGVFDEHNNSLDGNADGVNGDSFRLVFRCPLGGDINMDGTVSFADFLILSDNFGSTDAERHDGDLDGDGAVLFSDFLILADNMPKFG